jgi:hypothetical protein
MVMVNRLAEDYCIIGDEISPEANISAVSISDQNFTPKYPTYFKLVSSYCIKYVRTHKAGTVVELKGKYGWKELLHLP